MRSSGILLPISALPSGFGIGTMGEDSYKFIDFLFDSGQTFWQILPIGHTGYGDSPYQCFSAFAGNPYFIDPELLMKSGYIGKEDLPLKNFSQRIDYGELYNSRIKLIKKAASNVDLTSASFLNFADRNKYWLDDYALFMTLKAANRMKPLKKWDEDIKRPTQNTIEKLKFIYKDEKSIWEAVQFLFFKQWDDLKKYANSKKIKIIGDIPIYVSADSCEFWLHNELFITNEDDEPALLSGCPPDKYAPFGQLWGNPLYNWKLHRESGYSWWINRLRHSQKLFDVIRIDHFRGFEDYYAVDLYESNAVNGKWFKGPSKDFIAAVKKALPDIKIIAEDLGNITDEVRELLEFSGFPGMKVLQFGFEGARDSEYLPHNYIKHCLAYTGTHDNPTMKQWAILTDDESLTFAKKYINVNIADNFVNDCIRTLFSSVCDTVIIPMQDWLNLGANARMNVPSVPDGNWIWRMNGNDMNAELSQRISEMTKLYFRNNKEEN